MMPSDVSEMYGVGYQSGSVEASNLRAFDWIASVLNDTFAPKSVIDIGCGGGALIRGLLARGVDACGIEGSSWGAALLPERILQHDLRLPLASVDKFDLVTCFDTAEHIEEEFAIQFAQNIVSCVASDGVLVFGAAGEGQDGHGHVNCQHPCCWINRMPQLILDAPMSEVVRFRVKSNSDHSSAWWVAKNLIVLRPR